MSDPVIERIASEEPAIADLFGDALRPGTTVIRKADWRKGKKGTLGRVVSVHYPSRGNGTQYWHGPKARVQWMWHRSGGVRMSSGQGNSSLIYCAALQPVEVAVK